MRTPRALLAALGFLLLAAFAAPALATDTDSDGLTDADEAYFGTSPTQANTCGV